MSEHEKIIPLTNHLSRRYIGNKCRHDGRFQINTMTGDTFCADCDATISPAHALISLMTTWQIREARYEAMRKEAKELSEWVPHLRAVRRLHRIWAGRKRLPTCNHCHKPLRPEDITALCVMNTSPPQEREEES